MHSGTFMKRFGSLLLCALLSVTSVHAESVIWDGQNDPDRFDPSYQTHFGTLPISGSLPPEEVPWSDTYWPNNESGIAHRWNSKEPKDFTYIPPSRTEVARMTLEQMAELSPAEKYDLFLGDYSYKTVRAVRARTSPEAEDWNGICNGWAQAAIFHREPAPVTLTNPDGIAVPFGSSDVKGLLSYFYAKRKPSTVIQLGRRAGSFSRIFNPGAYKDVNAGAFHIVVTNQIGIKKIAFIGDLDSGTKVWNYPIYAYTSMVLAQGGPAETSAPGTVHRLMVETTVQVSSDEEDPQWDPIMGTDKFTFIEDTYRYWLELDGLGNIIGGEWRNNNHPDYLWISKKMDFTGPYQKLGEIYVPAVK